MLKIAALPKGLKRTERGAHGTVQVYPLSCVGRTKHCPCIIFVLSCCPTMVLPCLMASYGRRASSVALEFIKVTNMDCRAVGQPGTEYTASLACGAGTAGWTCLGEPSTTRGSTAMLGAAPSPRKEVLVPGQPFL